MDVFNDARKIINGNKIPLLNNKTPYDVVNQLVKCEVLEYYRSGQLGTYALPQHLHLSVMMKADNNISVENFETRLPGNFNKFLRIIYPNCKLYIDRVDINYNEKKFFHPADFISEKQYPKEIFNYIADIYRRGHSKQITNFLLSYISSNSLDENYYYNILRVVAVGAGKSKCDRSIHAKIIQMYHDYSSQHDFDSRYIIKNSLLMRGVAYSYAELGYCKRALDMVSKSYLNLNEVRKNPFEYEGVLHYQLLDSFFPTLETLSLCESLWGTKNKSLEYSEEMCNLFPFDARARIRYARSLQEVGDVTGSIKNFLYAGSLEHYFSMPCFLSAVLLSKNSSHEKIINDCLEKSFLPGVEGRNINLWKP